jgi:acetolactate synthase small subunit|tara:strand:+ start:162 stop:662 length:501 start_codon:yes stop_codon:yes gene_type:complete
MTKKLEELLNMAPSDGSTDELPEEIQPSQAIEVVNQVEKSLKDVDDIETALEGVTNLTANDKEMDDIADKAEDTFDNLMDLGMNVEARFSGQIFDTASKMLTITLNAKQAKIDKKLKMVELQLRKKALDARIDRDMGKLDGGTESGEATVLSRNELLDRILKKDNK